MAETRVVIPSRNAAPALSRVLRRLWVLFKRQPVGVASGFILAILLIIAIIGPVIQTHDPISTRGDALVAPSSAHLFGTDPTGRDVFSRTVAGARISLMVGVGVLVLVTVIGTAIGLIAGYVGGMVDLVLVRIVDMFLTIPTLLLALVIVTALGPSIPNVILAVSTVQTPNLIRLGALSRALGEGVGLCHGGSCRGGQGFSDSVGARTATDLRTGHSDGQRDSAPSHHRRGGPQLPWFGRTTSRALLGQGPSRFALCAGHCPVVVAGAGCVHRHHRAVGQHVRRHAA